MSIKADLTGPKLTYPDPATVFGKIDNDLKAHAGEARDRIVNTARGEITKRSGDTAAETVGSVRRLPSGFKVDLQNKVSAHVLRFLDRGTGQYGPLGRKIPKGKRGVLPGGHVPTGKGMKPQGTIGKILSSINTQVMPWAMDMMQAAWEKAISDASKGQK